MNSVDFKKALGEYLKSPIETMGEDPATVFDITSCAELDAFNSFLSWLEEKEKK